jgi:hypothetical protein
MSLHRSRRLAERNVRRSFNFWISVLAATPRANPPPGLFSSTY